MTILTLDPGISSRLDNLADLTEIRDQSGRVLGYFHPVRQVTGSNDVRRSPFTVEELRKRQQQRTGKPLSELLAKLEAS
jgi:hypothetical protein